MRFMDFDKEIKKIDEMLVCEMPPQMRESLQRKKDILINKKDVLK